MAVFFSCEPDAFARANGRTRLCDKSNTLGPEKPRWVNKNPSRVALAFLGLGFF